MADPVIATRRLGMVLRAKADYGDPACPPADNPAMDWSTSAEEFRTTC